MYPQASSRAVSAPKDDDKASINTLPLPAPTTSITALQATPCPPPIGGTSALSWFVDYLVWTHLRPFALSATGIIGTSNATAGQAEVQSVLDAHDATLQAIYAYYAKQDSSQPRIVAGSTAFTQSTLIGVGSGGSEQDRTINLKEFMMFLKDVGLGDGSVPVRDAVKVCCCCCDRPVGGCLKALS